MGRAPTVSVFIALAVCAATDTAAQSGKQALSLYGGPFTHEYVSQILQGHFVVDGPMLGLAYDRGIFYLGSGLTLEAEAQVTHFFSEQPYSTAAAGLGLRYDMTRIIGNYSSFAIYTGPSYADDPPRFDRRKGYFLEYVAIEVAVAPVMDSPWDGVIRMYHRSGAFGLYGSHTDGGTMLGVGIRRRF